jgi:hypothetical protein
MPGEIFDRYIEALGGWDALSAQKNRRIKGTFEGDPFQFKASVTIWWEADERYHLNIREPAGLYYDLFAVEGMTWSVVMNREPTPIGRVQRQEILDTAEFLGEANYKRRYSQIETMGEAKAGETPVYIVRRSPTRVAPTRSTSRKTRGCSWATASRTRARTARSA